MKALRYLVTAPLFALGALSTLYGVFCIVYRGDASGGATYVTIAGSQMSARVWGALSVGLGLLLLATGVAVVRRRWVGN